MNGAGGLLKRADHAAGDLVSGIAGRLGRKIVGLLMHDHRSAYDLGDGKLFRIDRHKGVTVAGKKRRQIAGMLRVRLHKRVVMVSGIGKIIRTVAVFMDVKAVEGRSPAGFRRKVIKFRRNQNAFVGRLIKPDGSFQIGISAAAVNAGEGLRGVIMHEIHKIIVTGIKNHNGSFIKRFVYLYAV